MSIAIGQFSLIKCYVNKIDLQKPLQHQQCGIKPISSIACRADIGEKIWGLSQSTYRFETPNIIIMLCMHSMMIACIDSKKLTKRQGKGQSPKWAKGSVHRHKRAIEGVAFSDCSSGLVVSRSMLASEESRKLASAPESIRVSILEDQERDVYVSGVSNLQHDFDIDAVLPKFQDEDFKQDVSEYLFCRLNLAACPGLSFIINISQQFLAILNPCCSYVTHDQCKTYKIK